MALTPRSDDKGRRRENVGDEYRSRSRDSRERFNHRWNNNRRTNDKGDR